MEKNRLTSAQLYHSCDVKQFSFETTEDLTPFQGVIGQERAIKALEFGLNMHKRGYNIYVAGERGTGRNSYVKLLTESVATKSEPPKDWVYVNNFKNLHHPIALSLDKGKAKKFAQLMSRSVTLIRNQLKEVFTSREYESAKSLLMKEYDQRVASIVEALNEKGREYGFLFAQNEQGLVSVPLMENGEPMEEETYKNLSSEDYERLKTKSANLSMEAVEYFNRIRNEEERLSNKMKSLDEKMAIRVIEFHIDNMKNKLVLSDRALDYLDTVAKDMIEHIDEFQEDLEEGDDKSNPFMIFNAGNKENFFERYDVNIFVDHESSETAPIVFENNPTYYNLVGAVEYRNELGVLKTDLMQIKPGALHMANGGYLVLHAKDILTAPFAWEALKRAILTDEITIENLGKVTGSIVTTSIKPEPIPLNVKIVIIGDFYTYSVLYAYDEEFRKLFKIMADFDVEVDRNEENIQRMARFIATHAERDGIRHFNRAAVSRIVEYSSRLSDHQEKMSSLLSKIVDILYEADTWASHYGDDLVRVEHIEKALREKQNRTNKYEEKILEMFENGDYLLDVEGDKVGEINGLAVVGTGHYSFGKPSKITVSTYRGKAGIVNIEREARTSGKIHDKGVMILQGYMGHKYAQDKPLALSASIVFEQLYSGVDGDSASSTELYALLSSLSGYPINQGIAVTGSVNQRGEIQPIGGVNEKIEGFYKVCKLKGLTGKQGVMIPIQNIKNLMLCEEVVKAVEKEKFHIYAVSSIDEGIEILTGKKAGTLKQRGSVHYKVNEKLKALAEIEIKKDKKE